MATPSALGLEAKLYYNSATYAAPTWVEIPNVRDLTNGLEKGKADVSTRGTGGFRANRGTLKEFTLTFGMVHDSADAGMIAVRNAFMNNTTMDVLVLDGPRLAAGNIGFRIPVCEVFKFERTENLEEALMVNVEMGPGYAPATPPVSVSSPQPPA